MSRFFVTEEQISDGVVRITGSDVNHIRNVLRMQDGDEFLAVCGAWEYTCKILPASDPRTEGSHPKDVVCAAITDAQKPGKELCAEIILYQCLPKADKMELVIQKAVELGVHAVVPVASARCVVRLDEKKAASRVKRWNAIAESAAKQAGRMVIPEVRAVQTYAEALETVAQEAADLRLIPYENATDMERTRRLLASAAPGQKIAVLIGPEGGFEPREVEAAERAGFTQISLGSRILRTETAGLCVLSALMLHLD